MNSVQEIQEEIIRQLNTHLGVDKKEASLRDIYLALVYTIKEKIAYPWIRSRDKQFLSKRIYLLSFEYSPEKFLARNLSYLNMNKVVADALENLGFSLQDILNEDIENRLGYGTLGELAYDMLDSATHEKIPMIAMGIRYQRGDLEQIIEKNQQIEEASDWLVNGHPWEYFKNYYYYIDFKNWKVKSSVYEIPIISRQMEFANTLRLFTSFNQSDFDYDTFEKGDLSHSYKNIIQSRAITECLYPNDTTPVGKEIRFKQEYFFASSAVQSIFRDEIMRFGDLKHLQDHISIQILGTHPTFSILEFIRRYKEAMSCTLEEALAVTGQVFNYTNERLLVEAMEHWSLDLIDTYTYDIKNLIVQIDQYAKNLTDNDKMQRLGLLPETIISNGQVNLVNLAYYISRHVTVLSDFHRRVLQTEKLKSLYQTYPRNIEVIRNGVNHRNTLIQANPMLTSTLKDIIGTDFMFDIKYLGKLEHYIDDAQVKNKIYQAKIWNKKNIANAIYRKNVLFINPYSLYDLHMKNFHEYKRQFMTCIYFFYLYRKLKNNTNIEICPRTFFFSGKAPANYYIAKELIAFVNSLAQVINKDRFIKEKIRIVFIENMNVSKHLKIATAADINENIAMPGLDTNSMSPFRYMVNGSATLGSRTGMNLELRNVLGGENVYIFGISYDDVLAQYEHGYYHPLEYLNTHQELKLLMDELYNFYDGDVRNSFRIIYDSILKYSDSFMILRDLNAYVRTQEKISKQFLDTEFWKNIQINNICKSAKFSMDDMILEYKEKIWS